MILTQDIKHKKFIIFYQKNVVVTPEYKISQVIEDCKGIDIVYFG